MFSIFYYYYICYYIYYLTLLVFSQYFFNNFLTLINLVNNYFYKYLQIVLFGLWDSLPVFVLLPLYQKKKIKVTRIKRNTLFYLGQADHLRRQNKNKTLASIIKSDKN